MAINFVATFDSKEYRDFGIADVKLKQASVG